MTGGTFFTLMLIVTVQSDCRGYAISNSETCLKSGQLPKPSSIFFAETFAILKAIRPIKRYYGPGQFIITTDSLSALKALEARKMNTKTIGNLIKIKFCLAAMITKGFTEMLVWISLHCNIAGNERADTLAKIAAIGGEPSNSELEFSITS